LREVWDFAPRRCTHACSCVCGRIVSQSAASCAMYKTAKNLGLRLVSMSAGSLASVQTHSDSATLNVLFAGRSSKECQSAVNEQFAAEKWLASDAESNAYACSAIILPFLLSFFFSCALSSHFFSFLRAGASDAGISRRAPGQPSSAGDQGHVVGSIGKHPSDGQDTGVPRPATTARRNRDSWLCKRRCAQRTLGATLQLPRAFS
jgi:hypothetical protein